MNSRTFEIPRHGGTSASTSLAAAAPRSFPAGGRRDAGALRKEKRRAASPFRKAARDFRRTEAGSPVISGLALRVALAVVAILAAGVAMTAVLSVHKFERTFTDFLASRFTFVVNDARQRIETQMDLGLPLSDLQGVSPMLQQYLQDDEQILSIEIFDEAGTVLFSTDPSFVGDLVSEEWMIAWRSVQGRGVWSELERDAGVVGMPLRNSLDQNVGSFALRYTREILDAGSEAQASRMLIVGAVVVLGMTPLCILGAMALIRRPRRELGALSDNLDEVTNRRLNPDASARSPEFAAFAAAAIAAHKAIDDATAEIRRLDELDEEEAS